MEPGAAVGAQPNDIAGIGRNFGLEEDHVEHLLASFCELFSWVDFLSRVACEPAPSR